VSARQTNGGTPAHGGDSGYTDLLGRRRVAKHDPLMEAIGALDEATSLLGVAKRAAGEARTHRLVHQAQHDIYEAMAELAMPPGHAQAQRIAAAHVAWLDRCVAALQAAVAVPRKFVVPGASDGSAPLDVARAAVRTAERRLARLAHDGVLQNPHTLAYVNRLSLLLYYLARAEDAAAGVDFDLAGAPAERPEA
jgi:cob(I)alamin adenosyltransferase